MKYWFAKGYSNVKRYKEISETLVKYGFGFFVDKLVDINLVPSYILTKKSDSLNLTTGERLRLICEELGPTFIKLGQIASTRSDIFPDDIIEELRKLQDNVKETSLESIKNIFEEEFEISIDKAFHYFDKEPIAAASIGQVHKATLLTGQEVVVKIQRPFIRKTIETDISILLQMSKHFDDYFKDMLPFSMNNVIIELTTSLKFELDYSKEGRNTERFRENFKEDENIYIPKVIWEYTSKRVLTQEWVEGVKVSKLKELNNVELDTKVLAEIGAKSFLRQVFIHGFFHGDPHPGNIIIINQNKIAFIDFGICGYLDKDTVNLITSIFIAGAKKDVERIVDLLHQIDAITDNTNIRRLKEDLLFLISHYYDIPLKKINMSEIIKEFMRIIYENHIKLPAQFTVLIKALITVEGTGRLLNPSFSISTILKDFSRDIIKHRFNLKEMFSNLNDFTQDIIYDLTILPKQLRNIIKILDKNQIKITLEEINIRNFEQELNRTSNRLSLSLIVSSLIIGASLALNLDSSSEVLGIPTISFIGYFIAAVLGIITLISIFRSSFKKS